MAFDDATRNRLQRFVSDARGVLTEDFTRQLQQTYGMDPATGEVSELAYLKHLDDQRLETAEILREIMDHYFATDEKRGEEARKSVLERIVREQAFTILNRLAALRMMEARGIQRESVGKGHQSQAFTLYQRVANGALGDTGETYRCFLLSLFDLLATDLPALFDRYAPQSRLFPRDAALIDVLKLINDAEIEPLWAEDETIGWIYQYYNSREERKAMRDASQAPRSSRELAVRNQYFTPRYVVEFLVDNTLGRLWFNWTGGETSLRVRCQYLLVKPEDKPEAAQKLRDPRTIKLLDPACGSMHFGLYAFDLLQEIYREAWDWEQAHGTGSLDTETGGSPDLKPIADTYADKDAFLHDVPRLTIEHNIYGVEIDPRAAQIASLALWLRAQRAWHEAGVKAEQRPQVGSGQVVSATAPPAEVDLRKRFMEELDPLDAELFEKTLFLLKGLPELGVLLKAEDELPRLVRSVFREHGELFSEEDMNQWQNADERLHDALVELAKTARSSYQGRLFAEDALQGLRIIDLCCESFDVVVMNPPFGEPGELSRPYLSKQYPGTYKNIFSTFIERSLELISDDGLLGAITSRTFLFLPDFQELRSSVLHTGKRLRLCAELGDDVLDNATVRVAASVVSKSPSEKSTWFTRIVDNSNSEKADLLRLRVVAEYNGESDNESYNVSPSLFSGLPKTVFSYTTPPFLLKVFSQHHHLQPHFAWVRRVPGTGDNEASLRLRTEVLEKDLAPRGNWLSYAKGGSFSPFFSECDLVIWVPDVSDILTEEKLSGISLSEKPQNVDLYGAPSLTFAYANDFGIDVRPLRAGSLFDSGGPIIFPNDFKSRWELMGLLNSRAVRRLLFILTPERFKQVGLVQNIPVPEGINKSIVKPTQNAVLAKMRIDCFNERSQNFVAPIVISNEGYTGSIKATIIAQLEAETEYWEAFSELDSYAFDAYEFDYQQIQTIIRDVGMIPTEYPAGDVQELIKRSDLTLGGKEVGKGGLTCSYQGSGILERICHQLKINPQSIISNDRIISSLIDLLKKEFSNAVLSWLVGSSFGRWNIGEAKNPVATHLAEGSFEMSSKDATQCLPCSAVRGILLSDKGHKLDLYDLIQYKIQEIWPERFAESEQEICQVLGVRSLSEVFVGGGAFFESHLKQYSVSTRKAPIYWPLSTESGTYTLWLYYPSLSSQTLYSAVNDFIEPKLKQVGEDVGGLSAKGASRTRDDEISFELLQELRHELIEMRDTLLEIAKKYRPDHNDGVQITAAPLWRLFRHKPWQKILKDTWTKLETGEYDWSHLAMAYWPDRVHEKCKTDKSLAIAHDLKHLYEEPEETSTTSLGRKRAGRR